MGGVQTCFSKEKKARRRSLLCLSNTGRGCLGRLEKRMDQHHGNRNWENWSCYKTSLSSGLVKTGNSGVQQHVEEVLEKDSISFTQFGG